MGDTNTWEDLLNGLGIGEHTVAHHLVEGQPVPDWDVQPEEFGALVTPSSNASAKALLLRTTLAEEKTYNLTVIDGKVTVLHAMTEPFELQAQGGKFVAFAGDFRSVASMNIPPDLVELPNVNSRTATTTNFTTIAVPVLDWDQIKTELEADGTRTLVARAAACGGGRRSLPLWTFIRSFRFRRVSRPCTSHRPLSVLRFCADRLSGNSFRRTKEETSDPCLTSCVRRPRGVTPTRTDPRHSRHGPS